MLTLNTHAEVWRDNSASTPQPARPVSTLLVRPEIRYDQALNGSKPFDGGRQNGALTMAADVALGF